MAVEQTREHGVTGLLCRPVDEVVYVDTTRDRPLYVFSVPGRDSFVSYDVEAYDSMLAAAKQGAGI